MNDRLKFRVWSKEHKKYYYIDKDNFDKYTDIVKDWVEDWETGEEEAIYYSYGELLFADDDNFVKEFYSDAQDKNGKLVFEGDIIKYDDTDEMSFWTRGEIGVVKFKPGRFSICLSPAYDGKMTGTSNMMQEDMEDCITIIGNIHQDSHLLGGK